MTQPFPPSPWMRVYQYQENREFTITPSHNGVGITYTLTNAAGNRWPIVSKHGLYHALELAELMIKDIENGVAP